MTKKNRGLLVSIVAGLIAIVLLIAVLLLHAFAPVAASEETAADHESEAATTPSTAHTRETMVMPDGSVMYMDDMGSTAAEPAHTTETMVRSDGSVMNVEDMGAVGSTEESAHHSMGGAIDWQVIGMILALIAACVSLATVLNAYLRRQIGNGAFLEGEAANG